MDVRRDPPHAYNHLLTHRRQGTVVADVCSHREPNVTLALVYLAALPYVGSIMERVSTLTIGGFPPGLTNTTDIVLNSPHQS